MALVEFSSGALTGRWLRMILVVFGGGAEVDQVLEMVLVALVVGLRW